MKMELKKFNELEKKSVWKFQQKERAMREALKATNQSQSHKTNERNYLKKQQEEAARGDTWKIPLLFKSK
jgi:hypothetical protein